MPDPCVSSRLSEPDPSHTLEERVVHWYFKLLDKNSSGDVGKKEIKPFKRFLRKKSKPKKCVKRFVEYCDVNDDKSLSIQELTGCLGATKEEGRADSRKRHSKSLAPRFARARVCPRGRGLALQSRLSLLSKGGELPRVPVPCPRDAGRDRPSEGGREERQERAVSEDEASCPVRGLPPQGLLPALRCRHSGPGVAAQ